jgi:hypothetical protein
MRAARVSKTSCLMAPINPIANGSTLQQFADEVIE